MISAQKIRIFSKPDSGLVYPEVQLDSATIVHQHVFVVDALIGRLWCTEKHIFGIGKSSSENQKKTDRTIARKKNKKSETEDFTSLC